LRSIDPPRPWTLEQSPADFFADLYASASERARAMALGLPSEPVEPKPVAPKRRRGKGAKKAEEI
jgi:hypothetical protein